MSLPLVQYLMKDGASLNAAKLVYPPLPDDFVPRRHLEPRLNLIARRPLTLVSAPAGYGKTTSVSAWLKKSTLYGAWLSLDESDNDFTLFLTYVLAAVRRRAATFGLELEAMLQRGAPPPVETFIGHFYAELDTLDRGVVLVLEDFHLIYLGEVLQLIGGFMRHPHPTFHLVLLSRHDPPLPLSSWRARNQMVDIRSADLRFNLEETTSFLNAALDQSADSKLIANLYARTEGWVAGLRLAAISLTYARGDVGKYLNDLDADTANQYIIEFLADQVLGELPSQKQAFLIQTSILSRLSGPLCEAVIALPNGDFDGRAMLHGLYRDNLFIVPLDGEQQWFRYHHLLGEFLQGRLNREYSVENVAQLHLRASRWFAEAGLLEEAIRHAMIAGNMAEAVEMAAAARHPLLNGERFGRLTSLFNLFPDEVIQGSPDLLLAKAWIIHSMRFDIAQLGALVAEIDTLLDRLDLEPSRAKLLRAENDALAGVALYYGLNPAASQARCSRALEVLPKSCYTVRGFARTYKAGSLQMMGDLAGAYEVLRQGRDEDMAVPGSPRSRHSAVTAFVCWMAADLTGVKQVGEYLLALSPLADAQITQAWGHYFLACALYHENHLIEARRHGEEAFTARLANPGFFAVYAGFALALIYQASGNQDKAKETVALTTSYAIGLQSTSLISAAQAFQVELDIMQGKVKQAGQWAEQMLPAMRLTALPLFYAPQLTIAKALLAANGLANRQVVADCLLTLRAHMESTHNIRFLIETLALEALFHDAQSNEGASLAALDRSLSLAKPSGFMRVYVDLGPPMQSLLNRLRGRSAHAEYILALLAAFPGGKPRVTEAMVEPLTEREFQIINLLAKRFSNKEIAQELYIATGTVKRHTVNIYQKFNVQSRREAVEAARRLGILE